MKRIVFLPLLAACAIAAPIVSDESRPALPAAPADRVSWQGSLGTSDRLGTEQSLGTLRGLPPVLSLDITSVDRGDMGIRPVVGHFSGEPRYYFFDAKLPAATATRAAAPRSRSRSFRLGSNPKDESPLDGQLAAPATPAPDGAKPTRTRTAKSTPAPFGDVRRALLLAAAKNVHIVWPLGSVNFREAAKVKLLTEKGGAHFKDAVFATVKAAYAGEFADKPERIVWEVGDAINTPAGFSLREPGAEGAATATNPNAYVQLYLAPAVEAIRAASKDIFGDERRVKIVLGGVADISRPASRDYLDALLDTEIDGEHAPTLKGRRAFEVIDAINFLASSAEPRLLGALHEKWIASGKVRGLWATGELGARGQGDLAVAVASFRWLGFWARREWNPLTARLIFRGDTEPHPGTVTRGEDMEKRLGDLLQNHPLTVLEDIRDVQVLSAGALEWHALRADAPGGERRYALLFVPDLTTQSALDTVKLLVAKDARGPLVSVSAHTVPRHKAMKAIKVKTSEDEGGMTVDLEKFEMAPDEAVLIEAVFAARS